VDDEKDTGRLEAFSDGVFAVAITLLVLNIRIPGIDLPAGKFLDNKQLGDALIDEWPMLIAYITSFATIGIMWINHHRLFEHIRRVNTTLQLLNLLLLLVIVFVPVPTALLTKYVAVPGQNLAALIYSGTFLLMAICFNLLWRYAAHRGRLLARNADMRAVDAISRQYMYGPLLYVITLVVAFINTPASIACGFVLALFFAIPGRPPLVEVQKESVRK
jgi:uncharacterized membrane protein